MSWRPLHAVDQLLGPQPCETKPARQGRLAKCLRGEKSAQALRRVVNILTAQTMDPDPFDESIWINRTKLGFWAVRAHYPERIVYCPSRVQQILGLGKSSVAAGFQGLGFQQSHLTPQEKESLSVCQLLKLGKWIARELRPGDANWNAAIPAQPDEELPPPDPGIDGSFQGDGGFNDDPFWTDDLCWK
jgi:hypothetical protein